ncbi:MAG: hypothetical protein JSV35_06445 [Candidatus Bathyarchaeota archaeon]|nr:MAG: hypothetical protein JSV35_06445 [Candidatus Bathyarchaeota archaeon]
MKHHSALILSFLTLIAVLCSATTIREGYSELQNPVVTASPSEAYVNEPVLVEANITVKSC